MCNTCGGPPPAGAKLMLCGGCKIVWYCSKGCQKHHWGRGGHKQACPQLQAQNLSILLLHSAIPVMKVQRPILVLRYY